MKVYHLKTSRVSGTNPDGTNRIETNKVKLTSEPVLEKYSRFMTVNGYVKAQPPEIVKVVDTKDTSKSLGKAEITKAQEIVDKILKAAPGQSKDLDHKALHEGQKKRNDELEKRLKALEKPTEPTPAKEPIGKGSVNEDLKPIGSKQVKQKGYGK